VHARVLTPPASLVQVMLVRKRDNFKLYAMKVIRKEYMILKQQVGNIKSERLLLQSVKVSVCVCALACVGRR
jgi:hypothetical protein